MTDRLQTVLDLPPGPGNPRNSEGDMLHLADGRIVLVYTHFTGSGSDHGAAYLAGRESADGGRTWSARDRVLLETDAGMNVMSVTLRRLPGGRILLFAMRKESLTDCRPVVYVSDDELATVSDPVCPIDDVGYYVLNNDRVVRLAGGRLIAPVALHNRPGWTEPDWSGTIHCYLSDDDGRTWRPNASELQGRLDDGTRMLVQEPGVVELADDRLLMVCRTDAGTQWQAFSEDGGETFTELAPGVLPSPRSPASIKRIPRTGDLLAVYNHREDGRPERTPLTVAVSSDEGRTWRHRQDLLTDPDGWYCYTAIHFTEDDHVLLAHCAGNRTHPRLSRMTVSRLPVAGLYG